MRRHAAKKRRKYLYLCIIMPPNLEYLLTLLLSRQGPSPPPLGRLCLHLRGKGLHNHDLRATTQEPQPLLLSSNIECSYWCPKFRKSSWHRQRLGCRTCEGLRTRAGAILTVWRPFVRLPNDNIPGQLLIYSPSAQGSRTSYLVAPDTGMSTSLLGLPGHPHRRSSPGAAAIGAAP